MERRGSRYRRGRGRSNRGGYREPIKRGPKLEETRIIDRTELPIYKCKDSIMSHIERYSVGIVEASTGSGKSTQVPQFLYEKYPECYIVIAQPNKLGANEIASKIAEELNSNIGGIVGTMFKGETKESLQTRIYFTTTDILLEHILNDNFKWDFIIIDEVHERSLETDLLLAVIKMRLNEGNQFKLLIMSATIQNILPSYFSSTEIKKSFGHEKRRKGNRDDIDWLDEQNFEDDKEEQKGEWMRRGYKDPADVFSNDARLFQVEEIYLEKALDIVKPLFNGVLRDQPERSSTDFASIFEKDADTNPPEVPNLAYELASRLILAQHLKLYRDEDRPYTFLVFLPGLVEINEMNDMLSKTFQEKISDLEIIHLHTNIPEEDYDRIFIPPEEGKRRVILSSSIAESSITLTDVRFIIDFGMSRETAYNNQKNADSFELVWAAKSIMKQRAGRAGRVANGIVFRLMPIQFFHSMLYDYARPEIQRSSLDKIILKLKMKSIENIRDLLGNILEAPDDIEIIKTERYLVEMGALSPIKKITKLGEIYSEFPFEIKVTRICMFGILFGCAKQAMLLGALISLERAPIKSYAGVPGNQSKHHPQTYKSRLIFDESSNSDLLMMLNAYDKWYQHFGRKCKRIIFKNGQRASAKGRIPDDEAKFCNYFFLDPYLLREALCLYCEIKQKFMSINMDKKHFKLPKVDKFVIKLCIAAAFPGKYLISNYELVDEVSRNKLIGKMGGNPKNTLLIPDIPPCVVPSDIESLISMNQVKPKNVSIVYSNALIEYENNVHPNTLKLVMWLGSYSRRFYNLAWVLLKRVYRDHNDRVYNKSMINFTINELNRIPTGQRREGVIVDINSDSTKDGTIVDEVVFLCKPEYPFKLAFKDLVSRADVLIEDDSVNSHTFTINTDLAEKFMLVCAEYIARKNLTIGRYSTLMPFFPLLPHIMSLLFCSRIEYIPNPSRTRYKGIKFTNFESFLTFDYSFTSEDAKTINKIRSDISTYLGNIEYIQDHTKQSTIKDEIIQLLKKQRIPVNYDLTDWREIIKWDQGFLLVETHTDEPGTVKLLEITEDESLFYGPEKMEEIQKAKIAYVKSLESTANSSTYCKTELICKYCEEAICGIEGISLFEEDPVLFSIIPYYGKLDTVYEPPENNEYIDYVLDNYMPSSWEICRNYHVIGWNEDNCTFVCEKSPIFFRLPMGKIVKLTKDLWDHDFYKLKNITDKAKKEFDNQKFNFKCLVCDEEFKKSQDFYAHVNQAFHKNRCAVFIEPYVPI